MGAAPGCTGDYERFRVHFERADRNSVPEWLTSHTDNPSSIRASLTMARENARTLRDRISSEMWNSLNRSYLRSVRAVATISRSDYCEAVRESTALFFGLAVATMPRDLGWLFMRTGWHLERADNVLRILQVRYRQYKGQEPVARGIELHRATSLLKSCSAFEAFRKSHHSALKPRRIAAFLLLDPNFPRSLRYSVQKVFESLQGFAPKSRRNVRTDAAGGLAKRAAHLHAECRADYRARGKAPSIEELLIALASISNATKAAYFDNALDVQRQAQNQWHQGSGQGQSQGRHLPESVSGKSVSKPGAWAAI